MSPRRALQSATAMCRLSSATSARALSARALSTIDSKLTTSVNKPTEPPLGLFGRIRQKFSRKKAVPAPVAKDTRPFFTRKWHKWSGQLRMETEIADLLLLDKFTSLSESLKSCDMPAGHPCHVLSEHSRSLVKGLWRLDILDKTTKVARILSELEKYHYDEQEKRKHNIEDLVEMSRQNAQAWRWDCEAALRLSLFQLYSKRLLAAVLEGAISIENVHSEEVLLKMVDTFLLGTSAERVAGHLQLYSPNMDQAQLQDAFYVVYDPEVATTSSALMIVKGLHADHAKKLPKFAELYLLDRLELNVKSRSVFCWADRQFTGIKPLADDHSFSVKEIISSREEYFEEGVEVGKLFSEAVAADRRVHYHDSKENRDTARKGVAFLVSCILLDAYFGQM